MAEIKFNVLEKPDASAFTIVNEGTDVATNATLTITSPNTDDTEATIVITGDDLIAFNGDGLNIIFSSTSFTGVNGKFEDGIYNFNIVADNSDEGDHVEGFAAIITAEVIKDALSYRTRMTKAVKEYIQEKMMLLNNLAYAASTGNQDSFNSNLSILQRMR